MKIRDQGLERELTVSTCCPIHIMYMGQIPCVQTEQLLLSADIGFSRLEGGRHNGMVHERVVASEASAVYMDQRI